MRSTNATDVHRKSGGAQWRDLLFLFGFSQTLFTRSATFSPYFLLHTIWSAVPRVQSFSSPVKPVHQP
ncbi:MAG TPA: hypothetical protein VFE27_03160 [Acidobacteriaceae bacterium]|nr:hypothetical protein [Acidobacteriaceae bacterium]